MNFLENIKEETLLVIPYSIKDKILNEINKANHLINVKLITLEQMKKNVYFDYDERAILYLIHNYNYQYEVAKNYIDNMYYIEDKNYSSLKLNQLLNLKKELDYNKLLIYNEGFKQYYQDKKIIVFGYDEIDKFNKNMLNKFTNVQIISKNNNNFIKKVYEFNTLEEEVIFVSKRIIDLIEKKVSLNKIFLVNVSSEYNNEIIKIFNMHKIPIDLINISSIATIPMVKNIMSYLKNSESFIDTINMIKESFDLKDENIYSIYITILNLFNKYNSLDYSFEDKISAIEYEINKIYLKPKINTNCIQLTNLIDNYFDDDEYVFLLGFNQSSVPFIYKDEDFISDIIKDEVCIEKSNELNELERIKTINAINSIRNIVITYKLHCLDLEYYPSDLIDNKTFIKENVEINYLKSYSKVLTSIKLAEMIDDLIKYDKKNDLLPIYFSTIDIPYLKYDNSFKLINKDNLIKYINNSLILSYTSLDSFYKCQFRYYLDNILKLNKYEETFNTVVGSLFHYVLSKSYNKDFDLDKVYDYYLKDKTFTSKEYFFLNKLKKELKIVCDQLKEFNFVTGLTNVFLEKNISIDKSTSINVLFKGIVDKIMYKEYDGQTLISIIDYKTGSTEIDILNLPYGIGMQLVIYLYLISKSNIFEKYTFVGFYLQRILSGEVNIEEGKSYLDIKYSNLKFYGYSTKDTLSLERFDPTYENSQYIKGMKYGKNGFYHYSKVIDNDTMNKLIDIVDKKIDYARDNILNGNFAINPKAFINDKEVIGCKYCNYKDICFRKNDDIVNLKKYSDLSFLNEEGDESA